MSTLDAAKQSIQQTLLPVVTHLQFAAMLLAVTLLGQSTGTNRAEPHFTPYADGAGIKTIEDGHYPTGFA